MNELIDIEGRVAEWARSNPFLTDRLLFDFLGGNDGNCSITPVAAPRAVKTYVNGTSIKEYTFALQVMFAISESTDNTNTENMFTLRKWQSWILEQEQYRNYPDFGSKCSDYRLELLGNMPQMAMRYENGTAKYQFFAKITYREDK